MRYYKLTADVNRFDCLKVDAKGDKQLTALRGERVAANWKPLTVQTDVQTGKMGDFPGLSCHGKIPVFSRRAWEALAELLGGHVEALPLRGKAGDFFAINVLAIEDCLVEERTQFGRFESNNKIYRVEKYAFKRGYAPVSPIFWVPQVRDAVLVTDVLREQVERHGFTGLEWISLGDAPGARTGSARKQDKPSMRGNSAGRKKSSTPARKSRKRAMTAADLTAIERKLRVSLPEHYRALVLAYPPALLEAELDLGSWRQSPGNSLLFNNSKQVIALNQAVRKPGLLIADSESTAWPDHFLIIGADGSGNYWCLDLAGKSKAVWYFAHEEGIFELQSKSLEGHVRFVLKFIKSFNRRNP